MQPPPPALLGIEDVKPEHAGLDEMQDAESPERQFEKGRLYRTFTHQDI